MQCVEEMREKFMTKLLSVDKSLNSFLVSRQRYAELVSEVEEAQKRDKKTTLDYRRLHRYEILTKGNVKKLIAPLTGKNKEVLYYVHNDELFDIIHEAHLKCNHVGRNRMTIELKKKYKNITREAVAIYTSLCEVCKTGKRGRKPSSKPQSATPEGDPLKPLLKKEGALFYTIDMSADPDGLFTHILIYQDCTTKFTLMRPLKSATPEEIADVLVDIFCTFGVRSLLQNPNGDFTSDVISNIYKLWPDVRTIHHEPPDSDYNGPDHFISIWAEENKNEAWSEGLKFCQAQKNNTYHPSIKQTPHEATFGRKIIGNEAAEACVNFDNNSDDDSEDHADLINIKEETLYDAADHEDMGDDDDGSRSEDDEPQMLAKKSRLELTSL